MSRDDQKRAAAEAAVAEVADGMIVGIGSGSTASHAIAALGRRVATGLRITGVATSRASAAAARHVGIALVDLPPDGAVDLAIDGIDEIDPAFRAIKGAGGAMLREKVVANAARRMIAIGDASKPVATLGRGPVPVELLPFGAPLALARIAALGGEPVVRRDAAGAPVSSDQDNMLADCRFGAIADPAALAAELAAIPGLLAHGLFLTEVDALYLGEPSGVTRKERGHAAAGPAVEPDRHEGNAT